MNKKVLIRKAKLAEVDRIFAIQRAGWVLAHVNETYNISGINIENHFVDSDKFLEKIKANIDSLFVVEYAGGVRGFVGLVEKE